MTFSFRDRLAGVYLSPAAFAERVIFTTYGDSVSIAQKGKGLNKFGRNRTVGNAWETIAEFQGTVSNETFVSTNLIDSVTSSSGSDTTQTIVVEGHSVDALGNMTFVIQTVALNGQTPASLATPIARATRAYVGSTGVFGSTPAALVGTVFIYDGTDGQTAGTPTTAEATKLVILSGETQSEKAATTVSSDDYWIIMSITCAFGDTAASVDFASARMEIRDIANGGAWRPLGKDYTIWPDEVGLGYEFINPLIVPKNHDWRFIAKTDTATAEIYAEASGYLASVQ